MNKTEVSQGEGLTPKQDGATTVDELPSTPGMAVSEPPSLPPEEIEQLRADAAKAKEHWDKLLRTAADFENYKKRAARERQDVVRYANESLFQKLIPVLDSFESALLTTGQAPSASVESLQAGLQMIYQQLKSSLVEAGLEEIDAADKPFDPHWHEALSQEERTDVPEGQVVQQIRKGYKLRDRLLRPASVVVAKEPGGKSST